MTSRPVDPALALHRLIADDGRLIAAPRRPIALETRLDLFRHMRRVRRLDERMQQLQRQGRIGFYGACTGQEAPPVAAGLALEANDWVFPALRECALLLVRGFPLERYVAQLFGNAEDVLLGRQMPSHMASRRERFVSWSSAIATQLPQAVGAAMAAARAGRGDVVLAFLGDGATSHPDFHAALNFAGVFRAPVVFVCQNNHYAISVPASRQTAASSFAIKALAYGVEAARVDGNDALAVYDAIAEALETARGGAGPTLLECVTYRIGAHSSSDDPSRYRDEAEVETWRASDPIRRLATHLEHEGVLEGGVEERIVRELDAEIDRAVARAAEIPLPRVETLFDDVYARPPWHLVEQRAAAVSAASGK